MSGCGRRPAAEGIGDSLPGGGRIRTDFEKQLLGGRLQGAKGLSALPVAGGTAKTELSRLAIPCFGQPGEFRFCGDMRRYFTLMVMVAASTPSAEAVRLNSPGISVDCTIAVSLPLKRCIWGRWKRSRQVGSPLAEAL